MGSDIYVHKSVCLRVLFLEQRYVPQLSTINARQDNQPTNQNPMPQNTQTHTRVRINQRETMDYIEQ